MKRIVFLSLFIIMLSVFLFGCSASKNINSSKNGSNSDSLAEEKKSKSETDADSNKDDGRVASEEKDDAMENQDTTEAANIEEVYTFIIPEGNTLATRIQPPLGYQRAEESDHSFASFMRNHTVKQDGSPVLLYNGEEKSNQSDHVAVFDITVGDKDLQQCADSIMRMYGEYFWSIGEYDKIAFHLTNNFLMKYNKWREGYRLKVDGNDTSMVKSAEYDDSYETFLSYLERVFMFAGTLSLNAESKEINLAEIMPGDMFIKGGSPGHCVLVVDMVENGDGEKAFLLAQGYMPAQEFHVLKNPLHEDDPWYYYAEITYPLKTPQWTFDEGSLKRWLQ